jgi:hypothetical protein
MFLFVLPPLWEELFWVPAAPSAWAPEMNTQEAELLSPTQL